MKVCQSAPKETKYEELLKVLPDNEPRYIVVDFDYHSKDGRDVE